MKCSKHVHANAGRRYENNKLKSCKKATLNIPSNDQDWQTKDCSGKNVRDGRHGLVHEKTAVKAKTKHSKSRKH